MSHEENNHEDTHTSRESEQSEKSSLAEIARFALIALIIVLPIRWYVAQPFIVSGASMEETFHNNDYLIVDQITYRFEEPKRGDVVIFKYPRDHSKYFIKRLIGLPGETVVIEGNTVTIKNTENPEGLKLDESYADLGENRFDQTVELDEGEYFVMGDNRDHSSDSRIWGVLKREEIVGRAVVRLLPPKNLGVMPGAIE
jgi:signal peptidase I